MSILLAFNFILLTHLKYSTEYMKFPPQQIWSIFNDLSQTRQRPVSFWKLLDKLIHSTRVLASAGKAKACKVHSFRGCMWSVQVKLWDGKGKGKCGFVLGIGTRRKSSRPRRDRDAHLPRPRRDRDVGFTSPDVSSSRDVIEALKYKFYWLQ